MTHEQQDLYKVLTGQYGPVFEAIEMWACINALNVKPFKVGDAWCFLYGKNTQEGIYGLGETIEEAARSFYHCICRSKA